eukprot:4023975-Pyramimonas_sp.AAC.1
MSVATQRLAYAIAEQPMRSLYYFTPELMRARRTCNLRRIVTYEGAHGARTLKSTEIFTSLPESAVAGLRRTRKDAMARVGPKKETLHTVGPRLKAPKKDLNGWSAT